MTGLQEIINLNMTSDEAKAYKLGLIWTDLTQKMHISHMAGKFNKVGDPRKSFLFKICYKVVKQLKDFPEEDYKDYITAQLQMLCEFTDGQVHAMVSPESLVGERAWIRWKIWKKRHDKAIPNAVEAGGEESRLKIKADLERTKNLFIDNFGKIPGFDEINNWIFDKNLIKWTSMGKVSPYFILLCPHIEKSLNGKNINDYFQFDLDVYKSSITPEVKEDYKLLFGE